MVNDNWEDSQGQLISDLWGGNPNLTAGSLSAAAVLTLEPGNYTAKVEGKDGTAGVAMVELYGIEFSDAGTSDTQQLDLTPGRPIGPACGYSIMVGRNPHRFRFRTGKPYQPE